MDLFNQHRAKLICAVVAVILIAAAALNYKLIAQSFDRSRAWLSHAWAAANPGANSSPGSNPEASPLRASDALTQTETSVQTYMRNHVAQDCTIYFLGWSDFSNSGQDSQITVQYRVVQPLHADTVASVRFTFQGARLVKTALLKSDLQRVNPAADDDVTAFHPAPPVQPPVQAAPPIRVSIRASTPPPVVVDLFSGPLMSALMDDNVVTIQLGDGFTLDQLSQAKQKAQEERKPLGFVLVWDQFFGHSSTSHGKDSVAALVHFYEVFHKDLVLVWVSHERELGSVPAAVKQGYNGPHEGGFAPNMAVTDATATEFITEIPYSGLDETGRNQLFADGGKEIDIWLATHPDATPTPPPAQ